MSGGGGDLGQGSGRGLGGGRVTDPCNVTSGGKQKPRMTGRSQGSGVMTACSIK